MGTIRDIAIKIKILWGRVKENALIVVVIILVALCAFGLGRLSVLYGQKEEFKIIYPEGQSASAIQGAVGVGETALPPPPSGGGAYIASATGSTYFFPWCPLAVKIALGNRVYFSSRVAAEAAGYHAGRCNGL
ncbi:MAG: hypothetical protein V4437_00145 [Patescibacteria group bacterium]